MDDIDSNLTNIRYIGDISINKSDILNLVFREKMTGLSVVRAKTTKGGEERSPTTCSRDKRWKMERGREEERSSAIACLIDKREERR